MRTELNTHGRKSHIRMRTELNALECPISECKQNLRNSSNPSGGPLDQPIKLSWNPLQGPSPCSAVSGILGPKLELANKPSCACNGVGSSVVSRIRDLGHNNSNRLQPTEHWAAREAQQFSAALGPGLILETQNRPASGSLHGACFSLCLCLCLSLCFS